METKFSERKTGLVEKATDFVCNFILVCIILGCAYGFIVMFWALTNTKGTM